MLAIAHPVVVAHHPSIRSSSSSATFRRTSRPSPSASFITRPPIYLQVKPQPATPPPPVEPPPAPAPAPPPPSAPPSPPVNIHSYPTPDLLRLLASLLTQIAATNDALSPAVTPTHSTQHSHLDVHSALWPTLTTASRGALVTASSTLTFHARNIPTISLEAYLLRILKYCPTTNEVFLALLVYFDRMSKLSNDAVGRGFVIDSYNIHRLVIAGVTVASKFFSDVFYTNSRYAKVGGLPLAELNELELQFLLLNDFRLVISTAEMQRYAEQLILFSTSASESTTITLNPAPPRPPPVSSSHLTNGRAASSTSTAPSPSPSPSPAPLPIPPPMVSSSRLQRAHPPRHVAAGQPSHAALVQMGAIDAYGGVLPGPSSALSSHHGSNGKVYGPQPTNIGAGTSYAHGSSSSSFTQPHPHPHLHPPAVNHRIRSPLADDGDGRSDAETETETEAETEEGESTTTDDEPTIRPGSVYGYGGDAASVYSVESERSGSGSVYDRERPESRASLGSMWDTGDEGGDEGDVCEEEGTEDEDDLQRGGVLVGRDSERKAEVQSRKETRKRTRSSGSEREESAGGTPGKEKAYAHVGGDYAMESP